MKRLPRARGEGQGLAPRRRARGGPSNLAPPRPLLWALDSVLLLLTNHVEPTALGHAFVAAQALVVGAFAQAEFIGLRRATAA